MAQTSMIPSLCGNLNLPNTICLRINCIFVINACCAVSISGGGGEQWYTSLPGVHCFYMSLLIALAASCCVQISGGLKVMEKKRSKA